MFRKGQVVLLEISVLIYSCYSSLLQNGTGNTVEHNGEADVTVIDGSSSSSRSKGSDNVDSSSVSSNDEIFTNSGSDLVEPKNT